MAAPLNYAAQYAQALANAYPYALHFGALYNTPNNTKYQVVNAQTIKIPKMNVTGRTDGDRDGIGEKRRNFSNEWETKALTNHRKWDTLVHPADIIQTNMVTTIQNITQTMNETEKFPEMDKYCISKIYAEWIALGNAARTDVLTMINILNIFDSMMENMDEKNVPQMGRILYITPAVSTIIKNAKEITRSLELKDNRTQITREVSRIDEVEIVKVPSNIMKTAFNFTIGAAVVPGAPSIRMALIHPTAVYTPVIYDFSQIDPPSAGSQGKWEYYEESFEDVFILNEKAPAIDFVISS
jgi:hypothetical protein